MLFLHIGLHKTGTTFLQKAVFPHWEGIRYLPEDKLEYLLRMRPDQNYLLSREGLSGQNWMSADERRACILELGRLFPDAKIIMSFRQHSGFIVSSYNQYLQHGGALPFDEYFSLELDNGFMERQDFLFRDKIEAVESAFGHMPLVILQDDIQKDLPKVLESIERFAGGRAPTPESVKTGRRYNQSVGYYPAKFLRVLNRKSRSELNPEGRYNLYHWRLKRVGLDPRSICQYGLSFLPSKPILSQAQRRAIEDYYNEDWQFVLDAAMASMQKKDHPQC